MGLSRHKRPPPRLHQEGSRVPAIYSTFLIFFLRLASPRSPRGRDAAAAAASRNHERKKSMNIQMIPLNALVSSPANVRKTGSKIGIDELASSIAAHGLLQNLQARPIADERYQVVAGGRRLAALKLLAKRKELAKDVTVGCNVWPVRMIRKSPRERHLSHSHI
jgi:hypothetical protein